MRTKYIALFSGWVCLIVCLPFSSCDESLPPYEQPQTVLRAELGVADGLTNRQVNCDAGFKSWDLSPIPFQISIINTFDETLEGLANSVFGQLEVWKKDTPDFGKSFLILGAVDPRHVRNNILTLDPGDTLDIGFLWYHDDEQNRRIWKAFSSRPLYTKIRARARIKVFKDTPELFPEEFEVTAKYDVDADNSPCDK